MSNVVQINPIENALMKGDLSRLSDDQRLSYYNNVCQSLGLNSLTQPFAYITLNGKLTLYAKRDATDQLRKIHKVSITISAREKIEDIYVVTAKATDADGRTDESTGAVNIAGVKGENLANAFLKAETKAKRRVTLSLCGLGLLDESEVDSIPAEAKAAPAAAPPQIESTAKAEEIMMAEGLGEYVVPFGKHHGRKLKDIDATDLGGYLNWLWKKNKAGEQMDPRAKELFEVGSTYLKETGY